MSRVLHSSLLIFLLSIGSLACGKSKETCQREAADLATMFKTMDTRRGIETRFVKLVRRDELAIAADEDGVLIEVSPTSVRSWGISADREVDLQPILDRILQRWREAKRVPRLLVAIDEATPWKQTASVFAAMEASGFKDISLVFARKPVHMTPPPKSSIDVQLDAAENAEPADRATKVAAIASEVVKDCESIKTLFASVSGGDKTTMMIEGLPPALIECNCKCDVGALKSLFFRLLANRAPTTTIPVTLGGEQLSLNEALPWSEASRQMTAGRVFSASAYSHPNVRPSTNERFVQRLGERLHLIALHDQGELQRGSVRRGDVSVE